jgi:hypothetical protein
LISAPYLQNSYFGAFFIFFHSSFFYYIFNLLITFEKIPAISLLISTFQHFFFFQLPPISFLFLSLFSKHFVFARFTPHPTSLVPNYRNIKTRKTEPSFMIPRPSHPAQDESSPAYQFSPFPPHFSSLIEAIFCTAFPSFVSTRASLSPAPIVSVISWSSVSRPPPTKKIAASHQLLRFFRRTRR